MEKKYIYPFNQKIPKYPKISDHSKEKDKIKEKWIQTFSEITEKENESTKIF